MITTGTKILVTGGAGFIGSHLVEALLREGSSVWSLDNYSTGKKENHIEGAIYIEGETKDIATLVNFTPDVIFHLGEYSRVEKSFEDMEMLWNSNKQGTFAVLEFAKKSGAKLIYAGSSTKFGDGGLGRNQSPYAWTKATNTELVINYGNWFSLPFAITYFYNVYGPREISTGPFATVIGIFTEKMREGKKLTVVSPGTQRRNFTHVYDIVRGLVLVGKNGLGDGFGLGAKESYSILEIAAHFGGEIQMLPERRGNRMSASLETDKSEALGWLPLVRIEDHIKSLRYEKVK